MSASQDLKQAGGGVSLPVPLTARQIMLERIEEACRPGTPVAFRRRILSEAAAFIREYHDA